MLGEISGQYQSQVKGFLKIYHYVWNSLKVTWPFLLFYCIHFSKNDLNFLLDSQSISEGSHCRECFNL